MKSSFIQCRNQLAACNVHDLGFSRLCLEKKDLIQWVLCKIILRSTKAWLKLLVITVLWIQKFYARVFPKLFFGYFCKCMLLSTWNVKEVYNALMYSNSLFLLYFVRELVLLSDLSNFKTFGSEWNICNKELILGGQSDMPLPSVQTEISSF